MNCLCSKNKFKKGDWSWWSNTCEFCQKLGYGKERFIKYTLKHRLRLLIGIHGKQLDGSYCYNRLSTFLNWIIGYKKL